MCRPSRFRQLIPPVQATRSSAVSRFSLEKEFQKRKLCGVQISMPRSPRRKWGHKNRSVPGRSLKKSGRIAAQACKPALAKCKDGVVQVTLSHSVEIAMTLHDNTRTESATELARNAKPGAISPSETAIAKYAGRDLQMNRGIPLNLDWVNAVRVNTSAVERRAQSLVTRRTVKKEWQAAWLLRAITCMDLTTLSGDDTDERVLRLCAKARQPIQQEIVQKLGTESLNIRVAAVCVYHTFIETARRGVEGSGIHVAAVSTGFPAGLSPLAERVAEIRRSVEAGADEIDVVT